MTTEKTSKARLLFVTTSLGTKWESYSQALIELGYPQSKRVVVDGTKNWFPLMFLESALAQESDYTIHIDEDCFLFDAKQLDQLISHMENHEELVMAGVPDGGNFYREHNPYACNLFFLVFKTNAIRQLLKADPEWQSRKFDETFKNAPDLDLHTLDQSRVKFDDYEPYYGLFWTILGGGKRILYLDNSVDPNLLSTDVSFGSNNGPMARHMWYLRNWDKTELGPHDKIPNRERYSMVEKEILKLHGSEPGFMSILASLNRNRIVREGSRRAKRLISRLGLSSTARNS